MACLICGLLLIVGGLIAVKLYVKLTAKRNNSYVCLVGKTAIVTGANTGKYKHTISYLFSIKKAD